MFKSKMLRQRRQGGDQEEMGGYYIGEVNEVTLFSFFFDNASLFLVVSIIWILIQIRIRLKTLVTKVGSTPKPKKGGDRCRKLLSGLLLCISGLNTKLDIFFVTRLFLQLLVCAEACTSPRWARFAKKASCRSSRSSTRRGRCVVHFLYISYGQGGFILLVRP